MKKLLEKLKEIDAIKEGNFTLKSGEKSNIYFDIKKAYGDPKIFKEIILQISKLVPKETTCIAGSGNGGIPLATAISLNLDKKLSIVRDINKDHGIKKEIDGHIPTKDDEVVIVDDVLNSGTSLRNTIGKLEDKTNILKCLVILKRGEIKKINYKIEHLVAV